MLNTSFSPWPNFTEEEAEAVKRVLLSNKVSYWTGDECRTFEKEFSNFTNTKYAIALSNGSVALEIALKALDICKNDEVIVTSRTFLATASSIVNIGATPVFVDVDENSQNITYETIIPHISPKTKAIICVHLAGWPCDMDPIIKLAKKHGIFVIEDCAQAHGAIYKGRPVGSIGNIGCWSFCQDKIISTGGEGGMVTTNNKKLWSKMWSLKDHGKSWDAVYKQKHPPGFKWLHNSFGSNSRMTEVQAVIGRIQLKRINVWQSTRFKYASKIWDAARTTKSLTAPYFSCTSKNIPCTSNPCCKHAAYKCYVFTKNTKINRDEIISKINYLGVPCFTGSCSEVYLEKAFDNTGFRPERRLPIAKKLGLKSIMFLCHPTLTEDEIEKTCKVIKKICG